MNKSQSEEKLKRTESNLKICIISIFIIIGLFFIVVFQYEESNKTFNKEFCEDIYSRNVDYRQKNDELWNQISRQRDLNDILNKCFDENRVLEQDLKLKCSNPNLKVISTNTKYNCTYASECVNNLSLNGCSYDGCNWCCNNQCTVRMCGVNK